MHTRLILGPAGSGKTFRCLAEIRRELTAAPDGPPLLLLAPKQTTYQLERQLLADSAPAGYTRLQILSFDRLAFYILDRLQKPPPRLLDEEGRVMVLRGLLARKRHDLKLFRASARLTGFAQHLSTALRELQRSQLTPDSLDELAQQTSAVESLSFKLHDLATLLREYLEWLRAHNLHDAELLLDFATQSLRGPHHPLGLGEIWVDGFTEFSPSELDLLAELLPQSPAANVTFCLDRVPKEKYSTLDHWAVIERAFQKFHDRLARLPACELKTELLPRRASQGRFAASLLLAHLEAHWADPIALTETAALRKTLRTVACADPEAEATFAARQILRFVRGGGRYRDVTVLTRNLQDYHEPLANTFARFGIPFFLDRRESVSHHPLAELTRNSLRTVAYGWLREDWFAALKTGLVPADEAAIDQLENEALAYGWKGATWQQPINVPGDAARSQSLERLRQQILPPFNKLDLALRMALQPHRPTGAQLAKALRDFWRTLGVEKTLQGWTTTATEPRPIHLTVWEQMNGWLDNLDLAFSTEALPLREWLPILDAGLAGLSVGVLPPALDQVLGGTIDRSRNPEIRFALVLGMNESVFPAPPESSVLLTDSDRETLERKGATLPNLRQQLSRERFYGYLACTRARERLILTWSHTDANGKPLNPSPFLAQVKELVPGLDFETFPRSLDWRDAEHPNELIAPLMQDRSADNDSTSCQLAQLNDLPAVITLREQLSHLATVPTGESLTPALAAKLYGPALRTSVSRMEQFAACPFKFFIHSGLRAEERQLFELDARDQGNFQHDVLDLFHKQLRGEGKRWRDLTPAEARERISTIAAGMKAGFRAGLLQSSGQNRFAADVLVEALQDFIETAIGWMRSQYAFDPVQTELPFGAEDFPPWQLELGDNRRLLLNGRIDRIDLWPNDGGAEALCVVVDYKSSQRQLDPLMMQHGLQLQLPAYLNVLRHWPNPRPIFKTDRLIPAGVFYVNLRGRYERGGNREETLAGADEARKLAYRHSGRFDADRLRLLDQRADAKSGDQFNYRVNKDGSISNNSREALPPAQFLALLEGVELALQQMGNAIYQGIAKVDPFRKGSFTACDHCDYSSICRIDPWTHQYRVLEKTPEDKPA